MEKNTSLLLIIFSFILINNLLSQVTQEWVARYNGIGNNTDYATSIAVDNSGNIYVTGCSRSGTTSVTEDYTTIKYNSSGVQQWIAIYNGPGNSEDIANLIVIDNSGNIYITGRSHGIGTEFDYVTIKYNSSGVQQWVSRYDGPGNYDENALSLAVDNSGNVYVTGISAGSSFGADYATIKYNSLGVQQWVQRYNGPGNSNDGASSIAVDTLGNVYVTGLSEGIASAVDYATIKYNSSGVQQWVQRYNGPTNGDDVAKSITIDDSNNVYVTGESPGVGIGLDYATIKYNSSGIQQWVQRYNGPTNGADKAYTIAIDGLGNVYVTGESQVSGINYDYATIKYNSAGDSLWVQRYNGLGNGEDIALSLAVDGLGNVYVAGESPGSGTSLDYATIKYNSLGVQQWVQRYNGPGNSNDGASSIAVDTLGNVYVTGRSVGNGTSNDFATIKYTQLVKVKTVSNEIPSSYSLFQNYPNPFNPKTNIQFDLPKSGFVKLVIFDLLGREIATLVNESLHAGSYTVDWNANEYTSGVYFYKIQSGDFVETKNMFFVK